jgi:serine kinase of HPr protein (carbohydrate metabolism regulator)
MPKNVANHHCSVVVIDGAGVLIEGVSGSGKTSLALGLVDTAKARGLDAALVCDDQALLSRRDSRIVATAPAATAGLAELRYYGPSRVDHVAFCEIALVGRLADEETLERMPLAERTKLLDVDLPLVRLPRRHEQQSARIILAWLADNGRAIRTMAAKGCPEAAGGA